jgi:roadblock/LC7 domain-containing protein
MTLNNYATAHFLTDLNTLPKDRPNPSLLNDNDRADRNTYFFGGQEWSNCESNLSKIIPNHKKYFALCLFTMVCADQTMFTYYRGNYTNFRRLIVYPKFGWTGFGYHFEGPKYLLTVPVNFGVDFSEITNEELDEFIANQFSIAKSFMPPGVSVNEFFTNMLNDVDFYAETDIFVRLKASMLKNLSGLN